MITTATSIIIIISIVMALSAKEAGQLAAILFACYAFPVLALVVITWAVLAYRPD